MATFRWRGNGAGTKTAWNDGRNWVDENGAAYAEARYPGSVLNGSVGTWSALTHYNVGNVIEIDPYFYICTVEGDSSSGGAVWTPGLGDTVVDGTVTWVNIGANTVYDDVLFDAVLATGAQSPAGYDGSNDETLQSFKVGKAYNGTIGSSSSYLFASVEGADSDGIVIIDGENAGNIYLGGTQNQTINARRLVNVTVSGGTVYLYGWINYLICLKGQITVCSGSNVDKRLYVGYIMSQAETRVVLESNTIIVDDLIEDGFNYKVMITGGRVECNTSIRRGLEMFDGHWVHNGPGELTALYMYGGKVVWNGGHLKGSHIIGGTVDATQSQQSRVLQGAHVYKNGTLNINDGIGSITVYDYIEVLGGTVNAPVGTKLQAYVAP